MHLFFYAVINMVSMHFDILCQKLSEVKAMTLDESRKKIPKLIKLHDTLLGLKQNIEKIYSISMFLYFVISAMKVCLSGFQLLNSSSLENVVRLSSLLLLPLFGVFMTCFYGQKLTNASDNVAEAASDAVWAMTEDNDSRFMLLMMMQRSQKPNVIKALKLFNVSLKGFATVRF
jgi:7tm Odorant receptor